MNLSLSCFPSGRINWELTEPKEISTFFALVSHWLTSHPAPNHCDRQSFFAEVPSLLSSLKSISNLRVTTINTHESHSQLLGFQLSLSIFMALRYSNIT